MVSKLLRNFNFLKLFCSLFVIFAMLTDLPTSQAKSDVPSVELAETKDKKKSEEDDDDDDEGC